MSKTFDPKLFEDIEKEQERWQMELE